MANALEDILGLVNLTGTIQAIKSKVPKVLPEKFYKNGEGSRKQVLANQARYMQITGNRKTARTSQYGSPAKRREMRDVSEKDVKLLHSFEEMMIDPKTLTLLRSMDKWENDQGRDLVNYQLQEFGNYFGNLETTAIHMMLATGLIYLDGDGNLLPTSSGAVETIDAAVPSGNKNQLDVFGSGAIISASWATDTTDIELQIRGIHQAAIRKTGYPLKYAIYGKKIPSYLARNVSVREYMARQGDTRSKYLMSNAIPPGLFDLEWVPGYNAFYEDASGTLQGTFGDDVVIFTPDPDEGLWWDIIEGSINVPTTLNIQSNAMAALESMKLAYGLFAYAQVTHNPMGITAFTGHTFLPVITVPGAVFQADVTP